MLVRVRDAHAQNKSAVGLFFVGLFFLVSFVLLIPLPAGAVTLAEAYKAASQRSEQVGQAKERTTQASERVKQLRGGILPSLTLNGTHLIQPRPTDPIARDFFPERQTTVNLTLAQPLFRGFREFAGLRQQKNLLEAQRAAQDLTQSQLLQEVATSYFEILANEQDLRNLTEQVDVYKKRVGEMGGRVRRGESSSTDYIAAQSTEAGLNAQIELVSGQLRVARDNFNYLTGLSRDSQLDDPKVDASIESAKALKVDDYLRRIDMRPDIRVAREQADAASEAVSIETGAHYPTLDLVGNYYIQRPEGFMSEIDWDVQLRLSLPIYEGGATMARVRQATSRRTEAELELARLRRLADRDIRALFESAKSRVEQLAVLKKTVELAERNSRLLQRDYRRGLSRNVDVQLALADLRVAQRSFDQARFLLATELLQLEIAAARLPEGLNGGAL